MIDGGGVVCSLNNKPCLVGSQLVMLLITWIMVARRVVGRAMIMRSCCAALGSHSRRCLPCVVGGNSVWQQQWQEGDKHVTDNYEVHALSTS